MAVPIYKPFVNAFAYGQIAKLPDIPDARLMVGAVEHLAPLPLLIYKDVLPQQAKPLVQTAEEIPYERAVQSLDGVRLTVDDFPVNSFYLGQAVDGGL